MLTPQEITLKFIDPWLNKLAIDPKYIFPLFSCVIGYKVAPLDNRGGGWGSRFWFGRVANEKLFYNGAFFFRVMLLHPLAIWRLLLINAALWLLLTVPCVLSWLLFNTHAVPPLWLLIQPFGYVGIGIRWSGRNPTKREFLQCYIGWKLNGFFSAVFRAQSDVSAAEGFTAPNPNLAQGWFDGAK